MGGLIFSLARQKNDDDFLKIGGETCDGFLIGGVDFEFCKHKAQV